MDLNNPQTLISPDVSQLQRCPPPLFMNKCSNQSEDLRREAQVNESSPLTVGLNKLKGKLRPSRSPGARKHLQETAAGRQPAVCCFVCHKTSPLLRDGYCGDGCDNETQRKMKRLNRQCQKELNLEELRDRRPPPPKKILLSYLLPAAAAVIHHGRASSPNWLPQPQRRIEIWTRLPFLQC